MPLTDTAIKSAKARGKPYKLFDERGLYLIVSTTGGKWWRLKYRHEGREKLLSLGTYPDVPLHKARARRDELRSQVAEGTDPSAVRRAKRDAQLNTFEGVAREWLAKQQQKLSPRTYAKKLSWFDAYLFPTIGRQPIASVTAPDLLRALRRIEARGNHETAHRARSNAGAVFRYAIATGLADRDPSADLRGALSPVKVTNRAALTDPVAIGELLRRIDTYHGQPTTEAALKLAPYVFVRPGELRGAEWSELKLDGAHPEWRIPAARMKMRQLHIVPLARQAVAVIKALEPVTGGGRYVFPSLRGAHRSLSDGTINVALRSLGYAGTEMTGHGFRAMASTLLNERGFDTSVIELQLAHKEPNEVRAAYNRSTRLADRRKMMQAWADYLDRLREQQPKSSGRG